MGGKVGLPLFAQLELLPVCTDLRTYVLVMYVAPGKRNAVLKWVDLQYSTTVLYTGRDHCSFLSQSVSVLKWVDPQYSSEYSTTVRLFMYTGRDSLLIPDILSQSVSQCRSTQLLYSRSLAWRHHSCGLAIVLPLERCQRVQ